MKNAQAIGLWSVLAMLMVGIGVGAQVTAQTGGCEPVVLVNVVPEHMATVPTTTPPLEVKLGGQPGAVTCEHDFTQWVIATDDQFQNVVFNSGADGHNLFSLTVPEDHLSPGMDYYWMARPLEFEFEGPWSEFTGFTVASRTTSPHEEGEVEDLAPGAPRERRTAPILFPGARKPVTVTFAVIDGMAVFEGDILLGRVDGLGSAGGPHSADTQLAGQFPQGIGVRPTHGNLWPGGVVPYVIEGGFSQASINNINAAIQHWHANTAIRLVPRTTESDYVAFQPGGGCSSYVSRIGGKQEIKLAPGCGTGSIVHEIGHALGLFHEQSRCDRDQFVSILFQNIIPAMQNNFQNQCTAGSDLGSYDFGSIMHYPSLAFSANGQPTILTIPPGQPIGNRAGLSAGDLAGIQMLYGQAPPTVPGNVAPTVQLDVVKQASTLVFSANAQDPNGDLLTYEWSLNGVKQLVNNAQVNWGNPSQGTHTVAVKVSDGNGGQAQDSVTFTVSGGGGPPPPPPTPPPPAGLTIEDVIDANGNGFIDDNEILKAIEYWIMGTQVPGTGQAINDLKILDLLRLWITGAPIP